MVRRALAVLATLIVVGCGTTTAPTTPSPFVATPRPTEAPTTSTPGPTDPPPPAELTIDSLLSQMTTDEKIGQLFVVSFYGDTADEANPGQVKSNDKLIGADNIAAAIARYHLGGVIYFTWAGNLESATQIATLSNAIQAAGAAQPNSIPLLISTDQEGGSIVRLPPPATAFPGNMALGATGQSSLARATGRAIGEEVRALGINQILAPVGDVNVNPANPIIGLRSFGADATAVAALTAAMVHGFQDDAGVGATVKHFPGHGDTDIDSHSQLPIINHTATQWANTDQPPFTAAIGAGVDAVMVGHLAFPALDSSRTPASLSHPIVTDVLRGQMGYGGVVMTDALDMGALRDGYGDGRIPVMALLAGDDVLLMPPSLPVAWNAVKAAVHSGEISQALLDASVRRVLELKVRLGLFGAAPVPAADAPSALGTSSHRQVEQNAAEASVTLLANDADVLPLNGPADGGYLVVGPTAASVAALVDSIGERGWTVGGTVTGVAPTAAAIKNALTHAAHYGTLIDLTLNADTNPNQQKLVKALAATGTRLVTVSIGRPYDQGYYRAAVNLCLYSDTEASLDALVRVLFGEIAPQGHLPVAIPKGSDQTTVLYPLGFGLAY